MSREVMSMDRGRPFKCPYGCDSANTVSKGVRKTKTMGLRRIRLCKNCGRKFTPKNQKPTQPMEEKAIQTGGEPDEAAELSGIAKPDETDQSNQAVTEPTSDSKPLLNALDQEWTS